MLLDENDVDIVKDERDLNEFLFNISDGIIELNIEEQVRNCRDNTQNFFNYILTKVDSFKIYLNSVEDSPLIAKLDKYKDDICEKVKELLEERFNIEINLDDNMNRYKDLLVIYDVLVMRHSELLQNLVKKFIERDKKFLIEYFSKKKINKKDISYVNNKKLFDKENLILLLNLHEVLDFIKFDDCDDMIELMIDEKDESTYSLFLDFIREGKICLTREFCDVFNKDIQRNKNELMMICRVDYME